MIQFKEVDSDTKRSCGFELVDDGMVRVAVTRRSEDSAILLSIQLPFEEFRAKMKMFLEGTKCGECNI